MSIILKEDFRKKLNLMELMRSILILKVSYSYFLNHFIFLFILLNIENLYEIGTNIWKTLTFAKAR